MPDPVTNICTEVDLYADIEYCRGNATKPGVKPYILAIKKSNITTFPKPKGTAAANVEGVDVISDPFVLKTGAGWHRTELVPNVNSIGGESQGEWPSKSFLNTVVATMAGSGAKATGYATLLNNDDMIFLVPTRKGGFRLLGCEDEHVDVAVSQQSGQANGDQNQTQLTLTVTDDFLPPYYIGAISMLGGGEDPQKGITE